MCVLNFLLFDYTALFLNMYSVFQDSFLLPNRLCHLYMSPNDHHNQKGPGFVFLRGSSKQEIDLF